MMLPPPCFVVGMVFFGLAGLPRFPPNITMVIMAKQLQTVAWLFHGGFGAVASSLLSGLSGYVNIGLILLWI
jgi:hypothetical protein